MNKRFREKVVVVTGAASGIGKAVMNRLSEEGGRVHALDINSEELEKAVAGCYGVTAHSCDVSDQHAVFRTIAEIVDEEERIDVLANVAGIGNPAFRKLHEYSLEEFDRVQSVNTRGTFIMLRAVIPTMLSNGGGSIVNMASLGSFRASPKLGPYLVSKGAVKMMTRAAAMDYARDNIRVNAVCPSVTATDMMKSASPELMEKRLSMIPQGRMGTPEEVAALTAFLASDEAPHITGATYIIDGGRYAGDYLE